MSEKLGEKELKIFKSHFHKHPVVWAEFGGRTMLVTAWDRHGLSINGGMTHAWSDTQWWTDWRLSFDMGGSWTPALVVFGLPVLHAEPDRLEALEEALAWASEQAKGRLPDWWHNLVQGSELLESRLVKQDKLIARLQEDTDRLDYIEQTHRGLTCLAGFRGSDDEDRTRVWTADFESQVWDESLTAREAIDKARIKYPTN